MLEKYKVNTKKDIDEFVSTIVANKQGKIYRFIRKKSQKLDPGKKDLISGHIKQGEAPIQAIYREIYEETGIEVTQILQFYNLGDMDLPHPLLKNKKVHMYGTVVDFTEEQLNQSIKQNSIEKEIEIAEELESLQELEEDIKNGENWRIFWTPKLGEKINIMKQLIKEDAEKQKNLGLMEIGG